MVSLLDLVLSQIVADVRNKDMTAIEELLKHIPKDKLQNFLSETTEENIHA